MDFEEDPTKIKPSPTSLPERALVNGGQCSAYSL